MVDRGGIASRIVVFGSLYYRAEPHFLLRTAANDSSPKPALQGA